MKRFITVCLILLMITPLTVLAGQKIFELYRTETLYYPERSYSSGFTSTRFAELIQKELVEDLKRMIEEL